MTASPQFSQRLSCTRRGARLARRFTVQQLDQWGVPYGSDLSDTAAQVVAELAANAVTHGYVHGCDIVLGLHLAPDRLRIEVTDGRKDRQPRLRPATDGTSGRGLHLVTALASAWGTFDRALGKTVWAELLLAASAGNDVSHRGRQVRPAPDISGGRS